MKKGLLIASIASVMAVAGGLSFAVANANKGIRFEAVKATEKSFTFDASVGSSQFSTSSDYVSKSVVTGVSSNLETGIYLTDGYTNHSMVFGSDGNFVRNGSTDSGLSFLMSIGANNITSVSVTFGLNKVSYTVADEVQCGIYLMNKDGERVDETATSTTQLNKDLVLTWNKELSDEFKATSVDIRVAALNGSVYWGEPLYIKSVTLTWDC